MSIKWYSFKLKREHPLNEVCDDFNTFILNYNPFMVGNSIWGYGNLDELADPIHTYYCSINAEIDINLANLFLSKYSASHCKKPNSDKVGNVWGDIDTLHYE